MWMFLIFIVIPLIDLVSFVTGVGCSSLLSTWSARQAGPASTFTEAKAAMAQTEAQLSTFTRFCVMKPTAGGATGVTMKVIVTPVQSGSAQTFTAPGSIPNTPPTDPSDPNTPPLNTTNAVYQYEIVSAYDVLPMFNFSATPFLHDVPALGKPVPVRFVTTAAVEHPEGLNQ
jgi:hypothetical protein